MAVQDTLTSRVLPELRVDTYALMAWRGDELPVDGGDFDGDWEDELICESIDRRIGGLGGTATFRLLPILTGDPKIGRDFRLASIDDQVRVFVYPPDLDGVDAAERPEILFEGVLRRYQFDIQHDGNREREDLIFHAMAWPAIDNDMTVHQIRGRWVADDPSTSSVTKPRVIESADLPAAFNHRGRPNRADIAEFFSAASITGLTSASLFTTDDDPSGRYWTARAAIRTLLAMWLIGPDGEALPRHVGFDKDLQSVLNGDQQMLADPRFEGFDAVLPEVDVSGLGVFDAVRAVASAAGLDVAFDVVQDPDNGTWDTYGGVDRRYVLRMHRVGGGARRTIELSERRSQFATPDKLHRFNQVHAAQAMLDGQALTNEVDVYGRQFIEARVDLLPRWDPADESADAVDGELTREMPTDADGKIKPEEQTDYQQRHVAGGTRFDAHAHVGRRWGVHCLGSEAGYDSGDYAKPSAGFDWVGELGLGASPIADDREANGVTDAVKWSRRVRPLLPLRSPPARQAGIEYAVEVSEDGGSSWTVLDAAAINAQVAPDQCAIVLNHDNLATVSLDAIRTGTTPSASDSWWGLMKSGDLRFRLHCAVPSDAAARAFAARRGKSRSRYELGQTVAIDYSETYVSPDALFAAEAEEPSTSGEEDAEPVTDNVWSRIAGWGDVETPSPSQALLDAATRRQDRLDAIQISGTFRAPLAHLRRWRVGDAVERIAGRNIDLSLDAKEERYPTIVGIKYELAAGRQAVMLTIGDHRITEGGRRLG